MKISYVDKVTNEKMLRRTEGKPCLWNMITHRNNLTGHVEGKNIRVELRLISTK